MIASRGVQMQRGLFGDNIVQTGFGLKRTGMQVSATSLSISDTFYADACLVVEVVAV